jgi:tRNA-dihydrouridine synthase
MSAYSSQTQTGDNPAPAKKPFYVLAPMDDVTDTVFRQVVGSCAQPDLYMSEFVNVDGIQSAGRARLEPKLRRETQEDRLILQLWGKTPENYYKTVLEMKSHGYVGIDINMGCPEKNIVKNGCCSGLINNRELAGEIIRSVKEAAAGDIPVSVKTRLGFTKTDYTWHEFLLQQGIDMLTVHARTRKEMSKVPARWQDLEPIVALRNKISPHTLLVGNGDILTRQQGDELALAHGLDGVMVGRGVFQDPFVFAEHSPWPTVSRQERLELFMRHLTIYGETWQNDERPLVRLNKFCKIYVQSFEGAPELRERCMNAASLDDLKNIVQSALTTTL